MRVILVWVNADAIRLPLAITTSPSTTRVATPETKIEDVPPSVMEENDDTPGPSVHDAAPTNDNAPPVEHGNPNACRINHTKRKRKAFIVRTTSSRRLICRRS